MIFLYNGFGFFFFGCYSLWSVKKSTKSFYWFFFLKLLLWVLIELILKKFLFWLSDCCYSNKIIEELAHCTIFELFVVKGIFSAFHVIIVIIIGYVMDWFGGL